MSKTWEVQFVLWDRVDGVALSPETIGFARSNRFRNEVEKFVSGSDGMRPDEVRFRVEDGSYRLVLFLPLMLAQSLAADLAVLEREDSLEKIDPQRAEIVLKWQKQSRANRDIRYGIVGADSGGSRVEISSETNFRFGEIEPWVKVEKYLFGTISDMGGEQNVNVHVRLEESGERVRVRADQDYLAKQEVNRLYKRVLIRVEAEQHYRTGEVRNYRLLSFEDYESKYDEVAMRRFVEAGTRAWADVPDAAAWVRQLRGGEG